MHISNRFPKYRQSPAFLISISRPWDFVSWMTHALYGFIGTPSSNLNSLYVHPLVMIALKSLGMYFGVWEWYVVGSAKKKSHSKMTSNSLNSKTSDLLVIATSFYSSVINETKDYGIVGKRYRHLVMEVIWSLQPSAWQASDPPTEFVGPHMVGYW